MKILINIKLKKYNLKLFYFFFYLLLNNNYNILLILCILFYYYNKTILVKYKLFLFIFF